MCKIKDLDRNEVYDLTEIKKDSVKFDLLKEWLKENDTHWCKVRLKELKGYDVLYFNELEKRWYHNYASYYPTKCALTLFELDIADYQVDCSDLSKEQINNLCNIFEAKGYRLSSIQGALDVKGSFIYFRVPEDNNKVYGVFNYYEGQRVITYDKFIELFSEKEQWIQSDFGQYKLTEQGLVFHDDFDLELYKELGGLSNKKPIEQVKPSQYQIGIDTFTRAESNMTKDEILACVRFNIDKYTWRKKDQDKQDLEKIISYAQWGLKQLK